MHTEISEKSCLNCENFRRHYIMGATDMFITQYGHCNCYANGNKLIKTHEKNSACELWRPQYEPQSEYERILTALEKIKKELALSSCF